MPARIGVVDGRIMNIRIAIPRLWTARLGHNRIRGREPAEQGVVPPCIIVHQAKVTRIAVLAGVGVLGLQRTAGIAHLTPGLVPLFCGFHPAAAGGHHRAAQVVG